MTSPRLLVWPLAALLAATLAVSALAQSRPVTDVIVAPGRTAPEEGGLDYFHLNRDILGARSRGMGGAGLALRGDVDLYALNPAAIMGFERWQLVSEAVLMTGSAGVSSFPASLLVGTDPGSGLPITLDASAYRVTPGFEFNYGHLSLGIPVTLFGGRGNIAVSYRRERQSAQQDETRFEAVGPVTQNIPATIGVGVIPDGGYDAITVAVAREFGRLDLGASLNVIGGTNKREETLGAAVFGQVQAAGGTKYSQDYSGTNLDLGAIYDLGRLSLGGSLFLGFDMNYDPGIMIKDPLPNTADPTSPVFRIEQPLMEYTQSVPTQWGLGGAFDVTPRFTVAVDYWSQAWSGSEITRTSMSASPSYRGATFEEDPSDSIFDFTNFDFALVQGTGTESFDARMKDNNSLRVGFQFMAKDTERVQVPIWVGFRTETITLPQVTVESPYDQYAALVGVWWKFVHRGEEIPEELQGVLTPEAIDQALKDVLEYNQMLFTGENTTATTISFGSALTWDNVTFELSVESRSYDLDKFFFQRFDPTTQKTDSGEIYGPVNPFATSTKETRSQTAISFGARISF